jgi:List-Bact-rpt repeat protein
MPPSAFFSGHLRSIWVVLVLAVLVLSGLAILPVAHSTAALPARAGPAPAVHPPSTVVAPRPSLNTTLPFYSNNSNVANLPYADWYCFAFITLGCYDQAQNPTLVNLPNAQVGLGFSVITGFNSTNFVSCPSAPYTVTRVAFATSADNGTTFGAPTFLPTPSAPCDFVQQLEPSFAVSGSTVWGTYIATNATPATLNGAGTLNAAPTMFWTNRAYDSIVVQNSTNNGTTFGLTKTIATGGNMSNPTIVSFGKSLYVLFENISNGTTVLPSSGSASQLPISEQMLYSPDNGVTWHGPYILPGENGSQFYSAMGGSIAVNGAGELAVAYATNRSCINFCSSGLYTANGDDIVVVTSTTNGTSWSGIHTVASGQGEITRPYSYTQFSPSGTGLYAVFQDSPMTSIVWGTGPDLYVAWEAAPNLNTTYSPGYFYDYSRVVVYAGGSTNGGASWTSARASPGLSQSINAQGTFAEDWFSPSLGFHSGTVYLTYSYVNWGQLCGYLSFGTSFTTNTYSQWAATSTNGYAYTAASLVFLSTRSQGLAYYHDMGYHSSVGFTSAGSPLLAYALADGWFNGIRPGTYDFAVTLSVSQAYTGPTTNVTVVETGLAPSTPWSFELDGGKVTTIQSSVNVTGVPLGKVLILTWPGPGISTGYRAVEMPVPSAGPYLTLAGSTTLWLNFTTFYGISFLPSPNDYYLTVQFANYGAVFPYQFVFTWDTYISGSFVGYNTNGCALPWYFPSGTHFTIGPVFSYPVDASYYTQQFVGYWNGTGAGSYTGPGSWANLTVNSAFNESLWDIGVSSYSEQFSPVGLPASSTYSFQVDGSPYSAAGTTPVTVPNLVTGPHWVSNISATSTLPGWRYFGTSQGGNPLLVPIHPNDNLTFAFVNLSAPSGTVTFHALGVTTGSPWHLDFNGTEYSSTTPWINVTARPGTYPVGAGNVISANGSAALAPTGFGPTLSVIPAQIYDVNFTGTYKLSVLTSQGGSVAPAGASFWVAPSATKNLTATPASGFTFGGWSGTGPGSYTGTNATAVVRPTGPVVEAASFVPQAPNRFNLTVNETGLPAGTLWTVYLNGVGYSSNQSSFVIQNLYSCAVSGGLGTYGAYVPTLGESSGTEWIPSAATPRTACVTRPFTVAFSASYALTLSDTAGGSVTGAIVGNITWIPAGGSVVLQEIAQSGYSFLGWTGTGAGSVTSVLTSITVNPTGPVSEVAAWAANPPAGLPKYSVTFTASAGLPAGTAWSVVFNGSSYATASGPIVATGIPNGTYTYSVPVVGGAASGSRHIPAPTGSTIHVGGAPVPVLVPFSAQYWVEISEVGSGTVSPATGWFASAKVVVLNASPIGTALFEGWAGAGNGSYSGSSQGPTIHVLGPITEKATFVAPPSSTTTTPTVTASPSTALIIALAAIGLVVGTIVGLVLGRRGRPPASSPAEPPAAAPPVEESP